MITISDGILTIPEGERFLGFTGDNLHAQKKFLIRSAPQSGWLYRLYLTFDDGRHNHFILPATVSSEGTILTWDIQEDHIFKSGIVKAQIKAFSEEEEVYHTTSDIFVVGISTEEDEEFKNSNSEFLSYEKTLNDLYQKMQTASAQMPYVGENGNWYVYNIESEKYEDSGVSSTFSLPDGVVTPEKLDRSYWEKNSRASVAGYDYFDSILKDSSAADTVYRVEFSGLSPIKAVVGEGSFLAVTDINLTGLLLVNLTNGERWYYAKGSSTLVSCDETPQGSITASMLDRKYEEEVSVIKVMASNPDITLEDKTEFRLSEYAQNMTLSLPESFSENFECSLVFKSASPATSLSCPASVKWSGDDVTTANQGSVSCICLVPQTNKIYNVIFWYDGNYLNAVSRGVALE